MLTGNALFSDEERREFRDVEGDWDLRHDEFDEDDDEDGEDEE